jgi:hypothetical protein
MNTTFSKKKKVKKILTEMQQEEKNITMNQKQKYVTFIVAHQNQITDSMEQSPSGEANRSSASQEISWILWNPEVPYRIDKSRHVSLS